MTIVIPTPVPSASSWQVVDWLDASYSSDPATGGVAMLEVPQLPDTDRWRLTHGVVGCTSTATTSLRIYLTSVTNGNLRDGTDKGNFSVADWAPGLMIPPGRSLIVVWNGASDGAVGWLNLQAEVLRQVGS